MLAGPALADALRQAAPQLMLLSRCHGTDLVPLCLEAGVPWVWSCRGEVSDPIAVAAFVALLEALEAGHSLPAATAIAGQAIEGEFPGSSGMISLEGRAESPPLRLPLRRRRLWSQRLARSQRRQLVATGVALGLGLVAYWPGWVTGHRSGLPNRLLDSRLVVQTAWRDLRGVPPTLGVQEQTSPLVVWLLSSKVAYLEGTRVSRKVLATVLEALPPERAPVAAFQRTRSGLPSPVKSPRTPLPVGAVAARKAAVPAALFSCRRALSAALAAGRATPVGWPW
jgi:hypothetical protein